MGLVPVVTASELERASRAALDAQQQQPVIQGLAAHVRKRWESAKRAKVKVEERMLKCLRQRNGEYDPDKLAEIRKFGGSEIYMTISSTKARGAAAWLRDALLGTGTDKPWSLDCTPIPDLPPDVVQQLHGKLTNVVAQYIQSTGSLPSQDQVKSIAEQMRDSVQRGLLDEARKRVARMETKMEDQLDEGGFTEALNQFIDDIVTFPTAIMKGPIVRKRKTLEWVGGGLVPTDTLRPEWERVNPFNIYPAPWASSPHDGFLIERHANMTREDVEELLGLEGFSEPALREVLRDFGAGMTEMLSVDIREADAQGKDTSQIRHTNDTVDALQLWDSVPGSILQEWGVEGIDDLEKSYPCEVWLIGHLVIKATLNYDPLGRKPYYAASYERVPGAFWGNGVMDLIRDCQSMCNSSARALSNNMGISSGPQVYVNVSRIPAGEEISQLYPWKIWQFENSDYQDPSSPIQFFQPNSNAQELMAVYQQFSALADEYSGIPKYLMGEHEPGVGRTSSGLSMLISNASKSIKSVISSIDHNVITPLLERLYQYNLRYSQDPDLIGDVNIIAKGAMGLVAKEAAAVRRNEMLQLVLTNPVAQQIVGMPGTAELLRENARLLDINPDKIVPPEEKVQAMVQAQQQAQQAMMQAQTAPQTEHVQFSRDPTGAITGATKVRPKTVLPDGSVAGGVAQNMQRNRVTGVNG
jgi:hypothetical protein